MVSSGKVRRTRSPVHRRSRAPLPASSPIGIPPSPPNRNDPRTISSASADRLVSNPKTSHSLSMLWFLQHVPVDLAELRNRLSALRNGPSGRRTCSSGVCNRPSALRNGPSALRNGP